MKKICILILICGVIIASSLNIMAFNMVEYHINNYGQKSNNISLPQRYIVQVKPGSKQQVLNLLKNNNAKFKVKHDFEQSIYGFSAELNSKELLLLKNSKFVSSVKPVKLYYPLMDSAASVTNSDIARETFNNDGGGKVIAILDTGIDTQHESLNQLPNESVAKIKDVKQSSTTNYTLKVPYGYNFVDGNDVVKDSGSMHGVHVAGIAGAYKHTDTGINGIAPGSQLLAMKIFSNDEERKGAADDDIIAAIEDSIVHKADIINMSLGSDNGINDPNDPMLKAVEKAYQSGVMVVIAAGNSALSTTLSSSLPVVKNDLGKNDVGIISSPAVAKNGLAVASFENAKVYKKMAEYVVGGEKFSFAYNQQHGNLVTDELKVVHVGLGREQDYTQDVNGAIVLVKRGEISFAEKIQRALDKSAKGVLVYNNQAGSIGMAGLETVGDIFAASISQKDGEKLVSLLNENGKVKFNDKESLEVNDQNGRMSGFSSWGTDSSLSFKPEITGVGGQVYSSYNDNKYETISGTSMATPHVAGASAIIMNEVSKRYGLSGVALVDFTKKTMLNTATVLNDPDNDNIYSLRQQGSGLLNTLAAGQNPVTISFESESGQAVGELKEIKTSKEFDLVFKNYSNNSVTYNFDDSNIILNTQNNTADGKIKMVSIPNADLSLSQKQITIAPNSSQVIKVSLKLANELENFVEGVLYFNPTDSNLPKLHFSFMGYSGNWEKDEALDKPAYEDDSVYGLLPYVSLIQNFLSSSIVYPGTDLEGNLHKEYMAFSPNGDNVADYVIPQLGVLRGVTNLKFEIVSKENGVEKKIKTLDSQDNVRRFSLEKIKALDPDNKLINPFLDALWDGSQYDEQTGEDVKVKDGTYFYKLTYKLNSDSAEKTMYMPIIVDTKAPVIDIIVQNQKLYSEENGQRLVKFKVNDENGLLNVLVEYNNKVYTPTKLADGSYQLVLPYSGNSQDSITISAIDYAYNETTITKKFDSDPYAITFPRFVTKKVSSFSSDIYPTGKALPNVTKFEVVMTLQGDDSVVVKKEYPVDNSGNIRSAFNGIVPSQEGKYVVEFNQYDANGNLLRKIDFGQFVYDYTAPMVKFSDDITMESRSRKVNDILAEEGLPTSPLLDKQSGYKVVVNKNSDGSVTLSGSVSDKVHNYKEIKFTRGRNIDVVNIQKDNSFVYSYNPEDKFEFFNIKDPDYSKSVSATIDGLDLAGMDNSPKIKGKERTFVVIFKDSDNNDNNSNPVPTPEKKVWVNLDTKDRELDIMLGAAELEDSDKDSNLANVYLKDGQYYYDVIGSVINDTGAKIYINDQLLDSNKNEVRVTTDGSSLNFNKLISIKEGKNLINVRVVDKNNQEIKNVALKVWLDATKPTLDFDTTNLNIVATNQDDYDYIIETALPELEFNFKVSDNSSGYSLFINSDLVKKVDNGVAWGDNEASVSHKVVLPDVSDDDNDSIVQLLLTDVNGHFVSKKILVRRQENATNKLPIVSLIKMPELSLVKNEVKQNEQLEVVTKNITSDDIINVKIDGIVLNSDKYEFVNNKLVIKNLKEFNVGQHQLVVSTNKGSASVKFTLNKGDKPYYHIDDNNNLVDDDGNGIENVVVSRQDLIDQAKEIIGNGVKDKIDVPKPVKPNKSLLGQDKVKSQSSQSTSNNVTTNDKVTTSDGSQVTDSKTNESTNSQTSSDTNLQNKVVDGSLKDKEQVNNNYSLWIIIGVIALLSCLFLWWLLLLLLKRRKKDEQ